MAGVNPCVHISIKNTAKNLRYISTQCAEALETTALDENICDKKRVMYNIMMRVHRLTKQLQQAKIDLLDEDYIPMKTGAENYQFTACRRGSCLDI